MVKVKVSGLFKAIERWASESEDRVQLAIIAVWAGFGVVVLVSVAIAAWVMMASGHGVMMAGGHRGLS